MNNENQIGLAALSNQRENMSVEMTSSVEPNRISVEKIAEKEHLTTEQTIQQNTNKRSRLDDSEFDEQEDRESKSECDYDDDDEEESVEHNGQAKLAMSESSKSSDTEVALLAEKRLFKEEQNKIGGLPSAELNSVDYMSSLFTKIRQQHGSIQPDVCSSSFGNHSNDESNLTRTSSNASSTASSVSTVSSIGSNDSFNQHQLASSVSPSSFLHSTSNSSALNSSLLNDSHLKALFMSAAAAVSKTSNTNHYDQENPFTQTSNSEDGNFSSAAAAMAAFADQFAHMVRSRSSSVSEHSSASSTSSSSSHSISQMSNNGTNSNSSNLQLNKVIDMASKNLNSFLTSNPKELETTLSENLNYLSNNSGNNTTATASLIKQMLSSYQTNGTLKPATMNKLGNQKVQEESHSQSKEYSSNEKHSNETNEPSNGHLNKLQSQKEIHSIHYQPLSPPASSRKCSSSSTSSSLSSFSTSLPSSFHSSMSNEVNNLKLHHNHNHPNNPFLSFHQTDNQSIGINPMHVNNSNNGSSKPLGAQIGSNQFGAEPSNDDIKAKINELANKSLMNGTGATNTPCKVCGDEASGFHYGVDSCEGCKVS
jgi:hypothetical protein